MGNIDYLEEFLKLSKRIRNLSFASSDRDSGRSIANEIVSRDKKYSELLDSYTTVTKVRFALKEIHKWIFFWLVISACICIATLAYRLIVKVLNAEELQLVIEAVPAILTAFTAFVSTVIVVPMTITKFLFNTQEDDNITSLIQHTQQHDTAGIEMLKERFSKESDSKTEDKKAKPFSNEVTDD